MDLDPLQPIQFSDRAMDGLRLYNQQKFFEAHEALEDAWRKEPGILRTLYQGVLQVGVGFYHLQRRNPDGARKVFQRAWALLQTWQNIELPFHLNDLILLSEKLDRIARNQPERLKYLTVADLFVRIQIPG